MRVEMVAHIPLQQAGFCLSCESIFKLDEHCPACGDSNVVLLTSWIEPLNERERMSLSISGANTFRERLPSPAVPGFGAIQHGRNV